MEQIEESTKKVTRVSAMRMAILPTTGAELGFYTVSVKTP